MFLIEKAQVKCFQGGECSLIEVQFTVEIDLQGGLTPLEYINIPVFMKFKAIARAYELNTLLINFGGSEHFSSELPRLILTK